MPKHTKRLGRGLSSLISPTITDTHPLEEGMPTPPPDGAPDFNPDLAPEASANPAAQSPDRSHALGQAATTGPGTSPPVGVGAQGPARPSRAVAPRPDTGQATQPDSPPPQAPRPTTAEFPRSEAQIRPRDYARHPSVLRTDALVPHRYQPRQIIDPQTIGALAKSIARNGLLQPLVVRPLHGTDSQGSHTYEIIAGERRWRAAKSAGVDELPVVVRDVGDREALELALVENIQRQDLNAIDRAGAYETYCREFGFKPEEVAARLAEDRTTVTNYLRLLELPEEVKEMVAQGELGMGHARCILGISDANVRLDLARAAVANSLSVRALENIVRRRKAQAQASAASLPTPGRQVAKPAHLADVENRLQQAVGTKVTIREARRKGQGRIIIEYYSLDDFDRIAGRLGLVEE